MAEKEAQQSPGQNTAGSTKTHMYLKFTLITIRDTEVLSMADGKGKATNPADTRPISRPDDCEYCGVAKIVDGWPLFPAHDILAKMKDDEHAVEWTEWDTQRCHTVCRACAQFVVDESHTSSKGWNTPSDWGAVPGDPDPMTVSVGWGFSEVADEDDVPWKGFAPQPADWDEIVDLGPSLVGEGGAFDQDPNQAVGDIDGGAFPIADRRYCRS
ncbi:hypothetical protein FPV67DRAFT_1678341 [Lyophyllum atratum]|nr:hypothetical protein FPV67DRAFT_1678341 [Lyophyllum atratum]